MRLTEKDYISDLSDYTKVRYTCFDGSSIKCDQLDYNNELWNYVKAREDIEEELGIDLITLFKALKNGIYLVRTDVLTKNTKIVKTKIDDLHYWGIKNYRFWIKEYATDINIKNYGKTYALTKEELE